MLTRHLRGLRCTLFRAGLALGSLLSMNTFTYLLLFVTTQPETSCTFYKGMSDRKRDGPTMSPLGNLWPPVGGISALLGEAEEKEMDGILSEPLLVLAENWTQHPFTHLFSGSTDKWSLLYAKPGSCYL